MIHKYKHFILPILLGICTMVGWSQMPKRISVLTPKTQTKTQAVTDTFSYNLSDKLIDGLGKYIVLSENQKEMIEVKGAKIKGHFINKGIRTDTIMKQLHTEYEVALDSILTNEQKDQLILKSQQ